MYFREKIIEERKTFIPELDLLIQNYSGALYLFSDSLDNQSTVGIKAAIFFLFFNLSFLIGNLETVIYFPNSLEKYTYESFYAVFL